MRSNANCLKFLGQGHRFDRNLKAWEFSPTPLLLLCLWSSSETRDVFISGGRFIASSAELMLTVCARARCTMIKSFVMYKFVWLKNYSDDYYYYCTYIRVDLLNDELRPYYYLITLLLLYEMIRLSDFTRGFMFECFYCIFNNFMLVRV